MKEMVLHSITFELSPCGRMQVEVTGAVSVERRQYRKIGNSKNGNSVFSVKHMHCRPVLTYL